jgi:hypothetical protein
MASWVLMCPHCKTEFIYSKIEDSLKNYFLPTRPVVPDGGLELNCPHCDKSANYVRTDFMYQNSSRTRAGST